MSDPINSVNGVNGVNGVNDINIWKTHPNLYYMLMGLAVGFALLGLTFAFTTPTFNPLSIPYPIVGTVFFVLGIAKIVFLNFYRRLNVVRVLMAIEIFVAVGWGLGSAITWGQRLSSPQLSILYLLLAFIEYRLQLEPVINPLTKKDEQK